MPLFSMLIKYHLRHCRWYEGSEVVVKITSIRNLSPIQHRENNALLCQRIGIHVAKPRRGVHDPHTLQHRCRTRGTCFSESLFVNLVHPSIYVYEWPRSVIHGSVVHAKMLQWGKAIRCAFLDKKRRFNELDDRGGPFCMHVSLDGVLRKAFLRMSYCSEYGWLLWD